MGIPESDDGLRAELLRAPIEARRLILRLPVSGDVAAISRLINDRSIAENTGLIRYPYPPRSAWQWLAELDKATSDRFHLPFLLTLRSNPRLFIGAAGISVRGGRPPSIGYWLARGHRGRGYASEAARTLVSLLFTRGGVAAVEASARTTNFASQRVLEAAGMRRVRFGRIKSIQLGHYVPTIVYRIDRKSWENSQKSLSLNMPGQTALEIAR